MTSPNAAAVEGVERFTLAIWTLRDNWSCTDRLVQERDFDRIAADNVRLREALETVLVEARTCGDSRTSMDAGIDYIIDIAAAALAGTP